MLRQVYFSIYSRSCTYLSAGALASNPGANWCLLKYHPSFPWADNLDRACSKLQVSKMFNLRKYSVDTDTSTHSLPSICLYNSCVEWRIGSIWEEWECSRILVKCCTPAGHSSVILGGETSFLKMCIWWSNQNKKLHNTNTPITSSRVYSVAISEQICGEVIWGIATTSPEQVWQ